MKRRKKGENEIKGAISLKEREKKTRKERETEKKQ